MGFIAPLSQSWDWGAEIGYGYYGNDSVVGYNRTYNGLNLDAVFYYHLFPRVAFFAKTGLGYMIDGTHTLNQINQTALIAGAGLDYQITETISIGAEYLGYAPSIFWVNNNQVNNSGININVNSIDSLQLYLRFIFN